MFLSLLIFELNPFFCFVGRRIHLYRRHAEARVAPSGRRSVAALKETLAAPKETPFNVSARTSPAMHTRRMRMQS